MANLVCLVEVALSRVSFLISMFESAMKRDRQNKSEQTKKKPNKTRSSFFSAFVVVLFSRASKKNTLPDDFRLLKGVILPFWTLIYY